MRFLFILDPLAQLDPKWDTSLAIIRALAQRGHETWAAEAVSLWSRNSEIFAMTQLLRPRTVDSFRLSRPVPKNLLFFDQIHLRKEPPFDLRFLYLTQLLDLVADRVPVINHPRGVRDANEKLSSLNFPQWIPETLVTSSVDQILKFQKEIRSDLILKPLDDKAGTGIVLLRKRDRWARSLCEEATNRGAKMIAAQRFLTRPGVRGDKRILLLGGKILAAYDKHCRPGEFRANLSLGGTFHAAGITPGERKMVKEMENYLLDRGLYFAGIDVMMDKLIEINVTCPAGLPEAEILYPARRPLETTVKHFENFRPRIRKVRAASNPPVHIRAR